MKTVIFLGAGASKADGAPLQAELFKAYFTELRRPGPSVPHEMERELATFFLLLFQINVDHADLNLVEFPTFEEALGIIDLAESRMESFKDFDLLNFASNSNRLGFMRQYLVMLMVKIIDAKLRTSRGIHRRLIKNLQQKNLLASTIFVTTNYDILTDNALAALNPQNPYDGIDYGIEFDHVRSNAITNRSAIPKLFKLHGSLNWLYCPTCASITLTPGEKGIIRLVENFSQAACPPL